eukprot:SAG22_NODE_70_length_22717_cov_12.413741_3_plen_202_part_00
MTLANGFVQVVFELAPHPRLSSIRGDVSGRGRYGPNTCANRPDALHRGIVLERVGLEPDQDIWPVPAASSRCASAASPPTVAVLADTPAAVVARVGNVPDDCDEQWQAVRSVWTISLDRGARSFGLQVQATVLKRGVDVAAVSLSLYLEDPQVVAMFDEGTLATRDQTYPYFPAATPLAVRARPEEHARHHRHQGHHWRRR